MENEMKEILKRCHSRQRHSGMTNVFNGRGFTLIELLVVVLIIGILSAIALPQYNFAVEKARMAEAQTNAASLQKALDLWVLENGYPAKGSICFLGDNCAGKGQLAVDLESGMDCSIWNGGYCAGKHFAYYAGCHAPNAGITSCSIWTSRITNGDELVYDVQWDSYNNDNSKTWHGNECDYYPDVSPMGEKVCKWLKSQDDNFFLCKDC